MFGDGQQVRVGHTSANHLMKMLGWLDNLDVFLVLVVLNELQDIIIMSLQRRTLVANAVIDLSALQVRVVMVDVSGDRVDVLILTFIIFLARPQFVEQLIVVGGDACRGTCE